MLHAPPSAAHELDVVFVHGLYGESSSYLLPGPVADHRHHSSIPDLTDTTAVAYLVALVIASATAGPGSGVMGFTVRKY